MTGSRCWPAGTGWRPPRQRSLAATVEWSYRLLDETGAAGVPGGVGVPGAVHAGGRRGGRRAGDGGRRCCTWWTARCWSRRGPGRMAGPGTRCWRRCAATGPGCWPRPGSRTAAAAALAGWALGVAEQAAAGLQTSAGEPDAARWLDAEDATMRQVLAWAMDHDRAAALRLAAALGWWWLLRGRLPGAYPLLREAGRARRAGQRRGGAPRSSGSAGRRCSPPTRPGRWVISPRCATRWRAGRRPGRWPTPWPAGRWHCGNWARSPRRPRMPAVPWPWPARWAIRSGRCWPWCTSASAACGRRRPGRGGAAGPAGRSGPRRHPCPRWPGRAAWC